jgi:hypothetical protein
MTNTSKNSWMNASVVVTVNSLRAPEANVAYTLASALQALVEHVVIVSFADEAEAVMEQPELAVVTLAQLPQMVDWPTHLAINCSPQAGQARQLCQRIQQQGGLWIERHDGNGAGTEADGQWRLTRADDAEATTIIPQPRWSRWQEQLPINAFFKERLVQQLNSLSLPTWQAITSEPALEVETQERDVVMFWKQNDSTLYGRRNDCIADYLVQRDDVRRVIMFDPPVDIHQLRKKRGDDHFDQNRWVYLSTVLKAFRQYNDTVIRRVFVYDKPRQGMTDYLEFLAQQMAELGVNVPESVFWMYPRLLWGENIIQHFKPFKRIVDVVDDHRAWPGVDEKRKQQLSAHYRDMLNGADKVITNCLPVKLSMYPFNKQVALVPNGCSVTPPKDVPKHNEYYQRIAKHKGPVLGFVGNLEAKIDRELLERLALEVPDALLVLMGSTHANPSIRELQQRSNIVMTGVVPHRYVGAFIQRFTVGLVPHKRMDLTENMNPLKVYVYLSHHVPVVATDVPNIAKCDYVWQNTTHDEFIASVRDVIAQRSQLKTQIFDDFIKRNSWEMRLAAVTDGLLQKH